MWIPAITLQQNVPNRTGLGPSWDPRDHMATTTVAGVQDAAQRLGLLSDFDPNTGVELIHQQRWCPRLDRLEHAGGGDIPSANGFADDEFGNLERPGFPRTLRG